MWEETRKNGLRYVESYIDPITGKRKRICVSVEKFSRTAKKAAAAYIAQEIEKRTREGEEPEKLTLGELISRYLAYQKLTVKQSTYSRNVYAYHALEQILDPDALVCRLNIRYIREKLTATGEEPVTLNGRRKRLIALINWAYENDYIADTQYISITKKFKPYKDTPHAQKIADKYLEPEELHDLTAAMTKEKWRLFTKFLALSGLRIGEAIALEMSDIDFKEHLIHVTKTFDSNNKIVDIPKTSKSVRDVYMQPQLEAVVREILINTKTEMLSKDFWTDLFICNRKGNHANYFSYTKYLRENAEKILGRKVTPHALRHTHASLLMADGVDIEAIARRLGHEDSKITREIYLHVTKKLEEKDREMIRGIRIVGI